MLSTRGARLAASQVIPWRFAPGSDNRYDPISNPSGIIHTMGGPRFPVAMAAHMNEYFNPFLPINPKHIITAAGLTPIHEMVALSLGDPGDGILISRPMYGRFVLDFGNTADLHIVYTDMDGVDPFSPSAVEKYQKTLDASIQAGIKVKALLIVNPHNPLGQCYPQSTLRELMRFCQRNSIHLISDEVYALAVYGIDSDDTVEFTSVLSVNPEGLIDVEKLHVFYGMSKDFAPGLRLGCLITQNSQLRKAVAANVRFHNPSGMAIAIGTAILEDRLFVDSFLKLCHVRLREHRLIMTKVLDKAAIKYHDKANAGLFLYADLSPWLPQVEDVPVRENARDFALAQKLLDGGVGVQPCEEHGELKGHFRLVYSLEKDVLVEGLRR
ncbi:pyridoxal phosphate-dependent transferase [Xylogone sp. PMI_703]|nr:pyridoxal phosphate-dependent transferase [Xylogone sp. PMI_703]